MPPSMSALHHEVPHITNEEIETLYDIVRDAQSLPDPPYRALFKAYDRARAQKIKSDDEASRYFTFLVRMQDACTKDEPLVDRFQRVLADMNIHVEIDPEGEGVEVTSNLDNVLVGGRNSRQSLLGRTSRRGSFDSFFDGAADKVPGMDYGDLPLRPRPRRASGAVSNGVGRKVNGNGTRRAASETNASRPRRSNSVSSRGSLRIHRDGFTRTQQFTDYDGDDSEQSSSFDRSHIQIPGVNAPLPDLGGGRSDYGVPGAMYGPSDTQFVRDAETFDYHRIINLTRSYLYKWRQQTGERIERREEMEAKALAFERSVLLPASLESWRVALQQKRQEVETERFFDRLQTRAEKARNLFLLTKAFTHWAQCAEDEVQRTSTARRHILRTRYFNAWRDITAVNELKIQHFVLAKFLYKWRARAAAIQEQNDMAVGLYEHNIVYRMYWQWFWSFGERRAPMLHRTHLARETFRKWAEIVRVLKEREAWATDQRDREILRRTLARLREKGATSQSQDTQADQFRETSLLSSGFFLLRKKAQLRPLEAQISARIDLRLVRSTFQEWHRDAQLSRRAREVDRMRILRNAFTAWNDRLRINALEERIDERVQVQCLYKWALASRVSLFQRVHNHRLKEDAFSNWVSKTVNQENTLENAERRFASFKRAQRLRFCLRKIESATVQRKDKEYLALSVSKPKLKRRTFDILLEKHNHLQQLDAWADRANYYVTVKHALKRWQTATEFARRNRRREAFAHVRRTVKTNLVRAAFTAWRDKAALITTAQQQADNQYSQHIIHTTASLLTHWRIQTTHLRTLEAQADQHHSTRLTHTALSTWTNRLRVLQTLDDQAVALRQESTDITAASCLKKLGWRLWTVKRQQETADALWQRNFEKHVRAMLRFWWEQTAERVAAREVGVEQGSPSPSVRRRRDDDSDNGHAGNHDDDDDDDGEDYNNDEDQDARIQAVESRIQRVPNTPGDADTTMNNPGDVTRALESWSPFDDNALGLENLDLSFSVNPSQSHSQRPRPPHRPATVPTPASAYRPPARLRPLTNPRIQALQQNKNKNPGSAQRTRAPRDETRDEETHLAPDISELGADGEDNEFWTSTPRAPPSHRQPNQALNSILKKTTYPRPQDPAFEDAIPSTKPGYLKTPSKRSVARAKRSDNFGLGFPPPGIDFRGVSPERVRAGARSAPPGVRYAQRAEQGQGQAGMGVRSFQSRLRDGGFVDDADADGEGVGRDAKGKGRARVGFV